MNVVSRALQALLIYAAALVPILSPFKASQHAARALVFAVRGIALFACRDDARVSSFLALVEFREFH